jgi:HD-GYP domain-containing protein (c-di-GMP phosphodiesterase class II)
MIPVVNHQIIVVIRLLPAMSNFSLEGDSHLATIATNSAPTRNPAPDSTQASRLVDIDRLVLGAALEFDLFDSHGKVVFHAGQTIDAGLLSEIRNRQVFTVGSSKYAAARKVLLAAFPQETVKRVLEVITETENALQEIVQSIKKAQGLLVSPVSRCVSQVTNQLRKDVASALGVLACLRANKPTDYSRHIINHSLQLSALSTSLSLLRGDDSRLTFEIGLAGILHDVALLIDQMEEVSDTVGRSVGYRTSFQKHPLFSERLFRGLPGISPDVLTMIRQVHEQADGSGFPNALRGEHICYGAKVLNIVDAFLNLTQSKKGARFLPSDAIAYLCSQTIHGKFDKEVFRALMATVSMYPIGSLVVLDGSSEAVVVKSNPANPMDPVVRELKNPDRDIDLSKSQRRMMDQAGSPTERVFSRIRKSQLTQTLWQIVP